jgi:hypothetical protein
MDDRLRTRWPIEMEGLSSSVLNPFHGNFLVRSEIPDSWTKGIKFGDLRAKDFKSDDDHPSGLNY